MMDDESDVIELTCICGKKARLHRVADGWHFDDPSWTIDELPSSWPEVTQTCHWITCGDPSHWIHNATRVEDDEETGG